MRTPIPTWTFALVVVRRGHQFLLVHERKHGQRWYLPAGRVEPGELLADGARRETLEESGVPVRLDGILRIEHTPQPDQSCRVRVFFLASPIDDTSPITAPNAHALEAGWFSLDELRRLPLRGPEVEQVCAHVEAGGPVYPMVLLQTEGTRWS